MKCLHYRSVNEQLKSEYGCKVYKLALSLPVTCPNRDGTKGNGGCIFCTGSGEFAECGSISSQIENAKKRVAGKIHGRAKYIAYFQSYTNTYAPVDKLEQWFEEAIEHEEIAIVSIATRPDCLGEDILSLLEKLNRKKRIWVELGLQTIHENTAKYIRRGYPLSDFDRAVAELKKRGIEVIVHQILGLPGEDASMMVQTTRYIGRSGADGIKFHLLYVALGTDLLTEYEKGRCRVMEMDEYFEVLSACLENIPSHMTVHRLTGDGDKRTLVAPLWTADKKTVLNRMKEYLEKHEIVQGSNF